ncbi:uncharacterized protein LOC130994433 [Salvia miltiorrhiza]|uniref:uncharacterized protein LOC130994433 n=1 Tax=Salvia miltiorrhiza TaxID=226208 RepID=UPI0025ABE0CE|nr:uncharacterized protein LOC130994433 [Salvia miltiorrhiza]
MAPDVPDWQAPLTAVQKQIDELVALFRNSHPSSSSTMDNHNPRGPLVRLDVPRFDGDDPHSWIFKIEEYFAYHNTPDTQRLQIVAFHLDGKASTWFQWLKSQHMLSTWSDFLARVRARFGPSQFEDPEGTLAKLTQQGSVGDYQSTFESLMGRVTGISEPLLISFYISGLQPSIRRELQMNRPSTLDETFALARVFESKYSEDPPSHHGSNRQFNRPAYSPSSVPRPPPAHTPTPPPSSHPITTPPITGPRRETTTAVPVRRLTPAETREKRERGLCFHCDQKWNPAHRCKSKGTVMLLEGDDIEPSEDIEPTEPADHSLDETLIMGDISSLHSLSGATHPRSLRLWGTTLNQRFQVMIDNGSTHNFITPALAERLKLPLSPVPSFRVRIGNDDSIICQHVCHHTTINLQGTDFTLDLFVLPIKGPDVILGIQWLQELGRVLHDYSHGRMEFTWNGQQVFLEGDPSLCSREISLSSLQALLQSDEVDSLFELWMLLTDEPAVPSIPLTELQDVSSYFRPLLTQFADVFTAPTGLPPHRLFDHRIHLDPGSKPINVRPYRYPHFQKSEMERLVQEMLDQGIIRPSHSPFSSPVLLVRKKDGSFRFCVDYRALNAVTVKDKFPIPTVDELIDELGTSTIFSKLDLRAGFHQIRMHNQDIFKTAFRTHDGHYEFLVMPFGLSNAPSTFQATMNYVLKKFLRCFVVVFFDDILIYSRSESEHLEHLSAVLSCLRTNCLYVKLSKCSFGTSSVAYLGHIVSAGELRVDPTKIQAMLDWPQPKTAKQLRGFLGLTGYYRKFIQHYASIAAPLTDLLRKDGFHWSTQASSSFTTLQQAMISAPVLRLPNFSKPFTIDTDASDLGLGAVLLQDNLPIAY